MLSLPKEEGESMIRLIGTAAFSAVLVWGQAPMYTAAQAAQGKTTFTQNCASCHGSALDDGEFAPPLRGTVFSQQWGGKTVETLYTYTSTRMPPTGPGSLSGEEYARSVAYIL